MSYMTAPRLRGLDDPTTVAYLAGLVDNNGGRIRIHKMKPTGAHPHLLNDSYSMFVAICSTDERLIEHLTEHIGGSWVHTNRLSNSRRWRIFGDNAARFLRAVQPLLVRRAPHARVALDFLDLQAEWKQKQAATDEVRAARELLWMQMRALDSNGRIPFPAEPYVKPAPPAPKPPRRTVKQRGLDDRRTTPEQDRAMRKAYLLGTTAKDLAPKYGVTPPIVLTRLRELGVATRGRGVKVRRFKPAEARRIIGGYRAGDTLDTLAEDHQTTVDRIRDVLDAHDLLAAAS